MTAISSRSSAFAYALIVCLVWALVPVSADADPPKDLVSYRDVVKKVLPAVVSIESKAKSVVNSATPLRRDDLRLPEEFRRLFRDFDFPFETPEVPFRNFGSGFIVNPNGVILTNHHVVKGADEVTVRLPDGRTFVSKDIKSDPKTDLAVVRIDAKDLPVLALGDSAAMEIGDRVLAVGAPFGFTGSVTSGIISGKGRNPRIAFYEDFLQTDAAINPGNSGGPLINLEGKVIGINTAIRSSSGGFQGVGLAIQSNAARTIMDKLLKDGAVHRGYLGVQVRRLDAETAERLKVKEDAGVLVVAVLADSPAEKAGIKTGDVLTTIGASAVKEPAELQRRVIDLPLKKPVAVAVIREGKVQDLQVTIEEQPADFGSLDRRP